MRERTFSRDAVLDLIMKVQEEMRTGRTPPIDQIRKWGFDLEQAEYRALINSCRKVLDEKRNQPRPDQLRAGPYG
jgi:hypothetical protein